MAEPIHRVGRVRSGPAPVAAAPRLERVEREDPREDEGERRRREREPRTAGEVVVRDAEGHLHVDVQA